MTTRWLLVFVFLAGVRGALEAAPDDDLRQYRLELDQFRAEYGVNELPDIRFFLFGMGHRAKLLYRDGTLINSLTGDVVHQWKIESDMIIPPDYLVILNSEDGREIQLVEDEQAVWLVEGKKRTPLEGTRSPVQLPRFSGHRYSSVLRVLHQELLINVLPQGPVPNYFVYHEPWYRDGAMTVLALQKTGNLELVRDWILGLREPYDHENAGESEADNLGQVLFLISLVSDRNHPLVEKVLAEVPRFRVDSPDGPYIRGQSDFSEHPVYQTKWLKYGLRALGLPDPYFIPLIEDGYSALFWLDYKEDYVPGGDSDDRDRYPYLGWACDHFHGTKKSPISNRDYPLTWEQSASQANYSALEILDPIYVEQRLAAPHTWHAAELILYLMDQANSTMLP